jgi:hypothetical protein
MQAQQVESKSLIPCPDCGHSCSKSAQACPACGKPLSEAPALKDEIFSHILSQSSVKTGMCITLLGLIKVLEGINSASVFADEILSINAVMFLLAGFLSYSALKSPSLSRRRVLGRTADILFSAGFCMLASICIIFAIKLL